MDIAIREELCWGTVRWRIAQVETELEGFVASLDATRLRLQCGEIIDAPHADEFVVSAQAWLASDYDRARAFQQAWDEYAEDCESWAECYAESGSSAVFGGASQGDAHLLAQEGAGPRPVAPKLSDFGLTGEITSYF